MSKIADPFATKNQPLIPSRHPLKNNEKLIRINTKQTLCNNLIYT